MKLKWVMLMVPQLPKNAENYLMEHSKTGERHSTEFKSPWRYF